MRKSLDEIQKINTKNLLRYYKAERKRYNIAKSTYAWGFDKVDYMWDYSDGYEKEKLEYEDWYDYLQMIKKELNTREHIS